MFLCDVGGKRFVWIFHVVEEETFDVLNNEIGVEIDHDCDGGDSTRLDSTLLVEQRALRQDLSPRSVEQGWLEQVDRNISSSRESICGVDVSGQPASTHVWNTRPAMCWSRWSAGSANGMNESIE